MKVKLSPAFSLPRDDAGLVSDPNEELLAEVDILRGELGGLIRELRQFIARARTHAGYDNPEEILNAIEEIIDA